MMAPVMRVDKVLSTVSILVLALQAATLGAPVDESDWPWWFQEPMTSNDASVNEPALVHQGSTFKSEKTEFDDVKPLLVDRKSLVDTDHIDGTESPHGIQQRSVFRDSTKRWPGGKVPYTIHPVFNKTARDQIVAVFNIIEMYYCIQFIPYANQTDYLQIVSNDICASLVGRTGGAQELSLNDGCLAQGRITHELMHALGFPHEHSRPDRDQFIIINWDNILPDKADEFQIRKESLMVDDLNTTYDFKSIMHYGAYAFSKNQLPTIEAREPGHVFGDGTTLSKTDRLELKRYYRGECTCTDNSDVNCELRKRDGYCTDNRPYMRENCPKICRMCGQGSRKVCQDKRYYCGVWKIRGYCTTRAGFMEKRCMQSCGLCVGN